jgi:vancomycin resistance protein VanJ
MHSSVEKDVPVFAHLRRPRRRGRIVAWLCWIYAILMAATWLFLRCAGDRSWLGAIAIFSPRWIAILPVIPLLPLAIAYNRRSLPILMITIIGTLFGVMGLCLPWRAMFIPKNSAPMIRVLTCNVHGRAVEARHLAELIAAVHPDIVMVQEWIPPYDYPLFADDGWNVVTTGEMCLASRFRIDTAGEVENAAAVHYIVETPGGNVNIFNVHFASPHLPLRDVLLGSQNGPADLKINIEKREYESRKINRIGQSIAGPVLIAGDFNLCPDSPIFLENLSNYSDAFSTAGFGFGWTYRIRWTDTRIDHILSNSQWTCRHCWLGPDVGSPHRPLIADYSVRSSR